MNCPALGPYGVACGQRGAHRVHQWTSGPEPGATILRWVDW